jgi:signal transduction histidine kinase
MSQRLANSVALEYDDEDVSTVVPLGTGTVFAAARDTSPAPKRGARLNPPVAAPVEFSQERRGDRAERPLRDQTADLDEAREEIKRHIARELHDGLGAELTAARFALANVHHALTASGDAAAAVAALSLAQRSLDAACEAGRRLVQELHTPKVAGGIVDALAEWTRAFSERTGLVTSFICSADLRLTQLPAEAALAVIRVAQEALNNVAKHADASRADVRLQTDSKRLMLIVEDDGRGMPPRARRAGAPDSIEARGFGLPGMRARCESFGGALRIASRLRGDAAGPYGPWTDDDRAPAGRSGTTVRAHFLWAAMVHEPGTPRGHRPQRVTRARRAR